MPAPVGRMASRCSPAMACSTMVCWSGLPASSAGSGLKLVKPNQRFSSFVASCRSRHQAQSGLRQPVSRSWRVSVPATGNWCLTQGGMTEFPPATESQARAKARFQRCRLAWSATARACVWQVLRLSRLFMTALASWPVGRSAFRVWAKTRSKPALPSAVVSQCQAVSRSGVVLAKASCWSAKRSRVSWLSR